MLQTFSLGYVLAGGRENVLQLWEFIRRYMECDDGAAQAYVDASICLPIHDRKKASFFRFCERLRDVRVGLGSLWSFLSHTVTLHLVAG